MTPEQPSQNQNPGETPGAEAWGMLEPLATQPESAAPAEGVSDVASRLDPSGENAAQAAVPEQTFSLPEITETVAAEGPSVGEAVVDEYSKRASEDLTREERTEIALQAKPVEATLNPDLSDTGEAPMDLPAPAPEQSSGLSAALDGELPQPEQPVSEPTPEQQQ